MSATYANPETGQIVDVKAEATDAATRLVEAIWKETADAYNLAPLTALAVAQKIANAVLAGAVKEHAEILAEPFKPQQTRMAGL